MVDRTSALDKNYEFEYSAEPKIDGISASLSYKDGKMVSNSVIKNKIRELIKNEDKMNPFSDLEISKVLHEEGFIVARRTVAKYRESLEISTSRLRKK